MSEEEEQSIGQGPNITTAREWARQWAAAVQEDNAAFQELIPVLEGLRASCVYGRRFDDARMFAWLRNVDPLTLCEALERLPGVDMRLRLDDAGLLAYMQGYVDAVENGQRRSWQQHLANEA